MSIGPWQIILVLVIVLIIFGAGKLPSVMGELAQGVKSFKKGIKEEPQKGTKRVASKTKSSKKTKKKT